MLLLKLFAVCTTLVAASCIEGNICTQYQWESLLSTLTGTYTDGAPSVIQENTRVSYDLNNTLLATTTNTTKNGQTTEVKNIYDYKQRTLYTIEGATCHKTLLEESFRNACVPQNFSFIWWAFYGSEGPNMFWMWEYQGDMGDLHYIIQTYNGYYGVTPIMEKTFGNVNGAPIFSNTDFLNMTAGIKDPGVFIPPPICKSADYQARKDAIPKRIGLFAF